MNILNPHTKVSLPMNCCNRFYGIAFDGCFFYLTAPQDCSIYKFNRYFKMIKIYKTDRAYNCICYDILENCFWVTAYKHHDIIYKLDRNMNEIDLLQVKNNQNACPPIVGLSYNCGEDTLLAAYKDYIAEISKESGQACTIHKICSGFYTGILSISPYYAAVYQDEKGQELQIFICDKCQIKNYRIPDSYSIHDILFYPCHEHEQDQLELILLDTKHDCRQNILFCKIKSCDITLCCCNYEVCNIHCRDEDKNGQCVCDLIESIALVETSLSHILNAEGEKLQKAVELANSTDELLEINKSVTRAILNVTQLEHVLYAKLNTANDLCKKSIPESLE